MWTSHDGSTLGHDDWLAASQNIVDLTSQTASWHTSNGSHSRRAASSQEHADTLMDAMLYDMGILSTPLPQGGHRESESAVFGQLHTGSSPAALEAATHEAPGGGASTLQEPTPDSPTSNTTTPVQHGIPHRVSDHVPSSAGTSHEASAAVASSEQISNAGAVRDACDNDIHALSLAMSPASPAPLHVKVRLAAGHAQQDNLDQLLAGGQTAHTTGVAADEAAAARAVGRSDEQILQRLQGALALSDPLCASADVVTGNSVMGDRQVCPSDSLQLQPHQSAVRADIAASEAHAEAGNFFSIDMAVPSSEDISDGDDFQPSINLSRRLTAARAVASTRQMPRFVAGLRRSRTAGRVAACSN